MCLLSLSSASGYQCVCPDGHTFIDDTQQQCNIPRTFNNSLHNSIMLCGKFPTCSKTVRQQRIVIIYGILLLKPQVRSATVTVRAALGLAGDGGRGRSGRGRQTLRCQPARSRRWAVEVRVGWLGVVTGIRLIQISTNGGFLIIVTTRRWGMEAYIKNSLPQQKIREF